MTDITDPDVPLPRRRRRPNQKAAVVGRRNVPSIPPPLPPREPIGEPVERAGQSARPPKLASFKQGDVEYVYQEAMAHGGVTEGMAKSTEALRIWKYSFRYLMQFMADDVSRAIDNGVLTCRQSSTQREFYRTDVYNFSQVKADAGLDRFNTTYGGIVDELQLYAFDVDVSGDRMDVVDGLPVHFNCIVIPDKAQLEVLCLTDDCDGIKTWITERLNRPPADSGPTAIASSEDPKAVAQHRFLVDRKCYVTVKTGDVISLSVDAIIKPTNRELNRTGGVCDVIDGAAGPVPLVACYNHVRKRGRVAPAKVIVTPAGKLPCSHLLHVVLPQMSGSIEPGKVVKEYKKLFKHVLQKLDKKKFRAAAMPLMTEELTGVSSRSVNVALLEALTSYKPRCRSKTITPTLHLVGSTELGTQTVLTLLNAQVQLGVNNNGKNKKKKIGPIQKVPMPGSTGNNSYTGNQ